MENAIISASIVMKISLELSIPGPVENLLEPNKMRLKIRKIIKQIRSGQFGQPAAHVCPPDPGDRRRARALMCVR